jgi:hypothetical protein
MKVAMGAITKPGMSHTRNCFKGITDCHACGDFLMAGWWNTNNQQKFADCALGMKTVSIHAE